MHFYPRSPCGERHANLRRHRRDNDFYPRSPCGERPWQRGSRITYVEFLSTLSLRRATNAHEQAPYTVWISIHALLAESDASRRAISAQSGAFLSTLSLRRATLRLYTGCAVGPDFYPRSPCGERRHLGFQLAHADAVFLSTLSLRRATINPASQTNLPGNFYPRSPCGERLVSRCAARPSTEDFYPRSPCGERRDVIAEITEAQSISIHALLAESDLTILLFIIAATVFLSTLSLRRAT